MKKVLPIVVFAGLVVASGVVHGLRTDRWGANQSLDEAARRIDDVPLEFGDWRGEKYTLADVDLGRAGIRGSLFARFTNVRTGAAFNIMLVCGRAGPISVHTPDVCYAGAGYEAFGSPELRDVALAGGDVKKFMGVRFRKPGSLSAARLDILWAWNGGDDWVASENPRLVFARHPVLYKLYVIREVSPRETSDQADPYPAFLSELLPALDRALYPKPAG